MINTQDHSMAHANGYSGAIKVPILGKESILVDYELWRNYVVHDLLSNIHTATYVLICDTNLAKLDYVPQFMRQFEQEKEKLKIDSRLLIYDQIRPGETSKSRKTKAEVEVLQISLQESY